MGRDAVITVARSTVESAALGRGQLLLVTGEAGIGKTALLAELTAAARDSGALVLWAQCWEGDGAPGYWPWVQVLRSGIAAGGDPGEAAMLLPENPSAVQAGQTDRFRLFDAVVTFLGRLAEKRRVLLVVDDLHWADDGSLRLLEFASRHLASHQVSLLGAYRDEEGGELLRRLASTYERVALQGLPRDDVAALMTTLTETPPPPAVVTDVWRRTGGNPFLVRELTRLLVAQGGYRGRPSPPPELLDRVRDILERRLARLSQPCVELLTIAAVIGPEARLDVLSRVAADADGGPGLLEEAVATRVLAEPTSSLGPYRFSHDLFRETILAGLPAPRRIDLHLAIGNVLEELRDEGVSVHPAELAAHFGAAAAAAPTEAVRYCVLAAEDAEARLAFEDARLLYERALTAVDQAPVPGSGERLELLLRVGGTRNRAGDATSARLAYEEAADLARAVADAAGLARAALGLHDLGKRYVHADVISALEEAVRVLPRRPSVLRARLLAALARELHHAIDAEQDWERAPLLAAEAVDAARSTGDQGTLAFCLLALHDARWRPGTASDRLPVLDEMLSSAGRAGDQDMVAQARLLRATALIELGEPTGPAELEAYCRHCEELGHARARYGAVTRRATAAVIADDLLAAEDLAARGLALGQSIGEQDARGVYETLMWALRRAGGTWHVSETVPNPGPLDSEPWPGLPLLEAAQHVATGSVSAAGRALRRLDLDTLPRRYDLEMLTFLAEAVAAAGTAEQRERVYRMMLAHAGTHVVVGGCAAYYGAVDHYLGMLAESLERTDDSQRHFTQAAEMHDRVGAPGWAERSRALAAACRPAPAAQACVFRRNGDVWTIAYGGTESHLPDVRACMPWRGCWSGRASPSTPCDCSPAVSRTPAPTTSSTIRPSGPTASGSPNSSPTSTRPNSTTTPTARSWRAPNGTR